jgi:N-acetylneuraminate synthase
MQSDKIITIRNKQISESSSPYVIAEVGVNYYDIAKKENIDFMDAAKLMISKAAKERADAVKFQTYKADSLASKNSPAYWDTSEEETRSQYELFKKYDSFGEEEYKKLSEYCLQQGVDFLSTPFDFQSADFLESLMPVYKISSSDITNHPFIEHIANKGKPIFLSTGASTVEEIKEALAVIEKEGCQDVVIMHCILNYPTQNRDANLGMIRHLKQLFPDNLIGYSDHTIPDSNMMILTTAFLFGATVIEKHFTLDKTLRGNDHYHSMDPDDLKRFINNLDILDEIIGKDRKEPLDSEEPARQFARRSIVANIDIPKGTVITNEMLTFKRPGTGISPKRIGEVVGKRAKKSIKNDELITQEILE